MNIKDLLLNGQNFLTMLKQFAVDVKDITIQDESVIGELAASVTNQEVFKENICIEGKNKDGIVNFFGTLHYNLLNKLAVFELQGFEQKSRALA